ncbi:hypothetical protein AMQ28_05450 [Acinetobacter sp. TTH0-4]|nr:hypothetical protein AMQ28_05450 [Acinetobacter sp. TTH0-4]
MDFGQAKIALFKFIYNLFILLSKIEFILFPISSKWFIFSKFKRLFYYYNLPVKPRLIPIKLSLPFFCCFLAPFSQKIKFPHTGQIKNKKPAE